MLQNIERVDTATMTVIQAIIFGLTLTTWLSKYASEHCSYSLLNDFMEDFFFAYDVYDFYDRFLEREETKSLTWLYVTAIFALVAMVKFVPVKPYNLSDPENISQEKWRILFSIIFNDINFVVIRFVSWCLYGLKVTDLIHPFKNFVFIIIGGIQLRHLNRENIECRACEEQKSFWLSN